jgi:hypothetical protein
MLPDDDVIASLDALRMLVVKIGAGHIAEVCEREGLERSDAIEILLSAGERDIDEISYPGLSDADAATMREMVKVRYAALLDAIALAKK